MITRDEISEIKQNLVKHKTRTFLTSFGVFWGIFMLLLLMASGDGLEKGVISMFSNFSSNYSYFYSNKTDIPYNGFQKDRTIKYVNEDITALLNEFPNKISYISGRDATFTSVTYNNIEDDFNLNAVAPDLIHLRILKLTKGRYINNKDIEDKRPSVVIGKEVQKKLFGNKNPLNEFIEINNNFYKVVGVSKSVRDGENGMNEDKTILLPISTFQQDFNRNNELGGISLATDSKKDEDLIAQYLKKRHNVHPEDDAIDWYSTREDLVRFTGLFAAIRIFMWIIGVGTLLSGIIGVSNIMLINIKERTKEIGIRKALGATPLMVLRLILLESIFLTTFSGYLGLSFGLFLVEGINRALFYFGIKNEFFRDPEINIFIVVVAMVSLVLAGFFAAFFPARKAALIRPIMALREDN